jgi:SecD/SecF fusion protein
VPMLRLIGDTKIDFLRWAKPAFAASWLLVLIGIGYGYSRGDDALGVEFKGGDDVTLRFVERVEADQVRAALDDVGVAVVPRYQRDLSTGTETLRVTAPFETADRVVSGLTAAFPDANFETLSIDQIGATISGELLKTAIIALFLAMLGILVYVASRYEFSFAVAAILAIVHDVAMTLGWYLLAGGQLNAIVVAALLTIIGFSINDTIVIFDRIREDLKLGVRGTFKDVINGALNKTLSRTIITSGTSLLAALALYVFGGGVIHDFAFTFLVGVIVGTYSTIFIASATVLWWHKGERPKLAAPVSDIDTTVAPQPS